MVNFVIFLWNDIVLDLVFFLSLGGVVILEVFSLGFLLMIKYDNFNYIIGDGEMIIVWDYCKVDFLWEGFGLYFIYYVLFIFN